MLQDLKMIEGALVFYTDKHTDPEGKEFFLAMIRKHLQQAIERATKGAERV